MKIRYWTVFTALVYSGSLNLAAEGIDLEVTADYFSKYVWRGQNLDDESVFQPSFSASYKGLTASIWGNFEMTSANGNSGEFTEIDYSIDYSGTFLGIKGVGYSVGMIYYDFPSTDFEGTSEVYWGFSFDLPLTPSITVYHDVDEVDGSYVLLGFGHSIERIAELNSDLPVGVEIGAGLGWGSSSYNKSYWGVDGSKMQDLTLSVGFPMDMGGWTATPSVNYVTLLNGTIRDKVADDDMFFAGVSLSKSF
jgi:hypothetical protein